MELQPSMAEEAQTLHPSRKRGGWVTFPFIAATLAGLMLSGLGWLTNLTVYLIEEFNVTSINAAQISNIVNGGINLLPFISAILVDSFSGSLSVVYISCVFSLLGAILLTLTASINSLRPPWCENGSTLCQAPSKTQFTVLYAALALGSVGFGAMRFTLATLGANQFDNPQCQSIFFNWFFFIFSGSSVIASIVIVCVEENISWGRGFGLCAASSFVALTIFLLGTRFYHHDEPQGSPYTGLARVAIAAMRKRKMSLSFYTENYYHEKDGMNKVMPTTPSQSLRFLNRAALKSEGDILSDGSVAKPWSLCTVQEVENLKTLVRVIPIWSSSVFVVTPIKIQYSMLVLQAMAMNRHLGSSFQIPAGTILVVVSISTCISLAIIDRFLLPAWKKLTYQSLTPLQRIGVGHVFIALSLTISALVESRRLQIAHVNHLQVQSGTVISMSVLWLFPQLVLNGVGEAFLLPGQAEFYCQEFPTALRGTAIAMVSVVSGAAFYFSTALLDLFRNVTGWLPDNINEGRLDSLYWTLVMMGLLNFVYYLVCVAMYTHTNVELRVDLSASDPNGETEIRAKRKELNRNGCYKFERFLISLWFPSSGAYPAVN